LTYRLVVVFVTVSFIFFLPATSLLLLNSLFLIFVIIFLLGFNFLH